MIGVQYRLENKDGDFIVLNDHSDPENLIALQDYPSFDLEIKNQEIQKEGQHGIWDFNSFYGKRLITFSGVIVGQDEASVIAIQDQLKLVCGLPLEPNSSNDGVLTISYTDPRGRALQTTGKLFSSIRFSRSMRENFKLAFQLVLKSANPNIVSQTETEDVGTRGYWAGSLKLPASMPNKINIVAMQTLEVENLGNTYTDTRITIHGALTNPRLENLTTGKFMQFTYNIGAGEYIYIDSLLGTIVNQAGTDISAFLDNGSEFIKIKSGINSLLLTSDENEGATNPIATRIAPTEVLESCHRDTYL